MTWLHRFMEELGKNRENSRLYSDKKNAIHIAKKSTFHLNTKHIKLKYHFIRSIFEDEMLKLEKIHTSQNPAYMLENLVTRKKLISSSVFVGIQS